MKKIIFILMLLAAASCAKEEIILEPQTQIKGGNIGFICNEDGYKLVKDELYKEAESKGLKIYFDESTAKESCFRKIYYLSELEKQEEEFKTQTLSLCNSDENCAPGEECRSELCEEQVPKAYFEFLDTFAGWEKVSTLPYGSEAEVVVRSSKINMLDQLPVTLKLFINKEQVWNKEIKDQEKCNSQDSCSIEGLYVRKSWESARVELFAFNNENKLIAKWDAGVPVKDKCRFTSSGNFKYAQSLFENTINSCEEAGTEKVLDALANHQEIACKLRCEQLAKDNDCICSSFVKSTQFSGCKKEDVYRINGETEGICFCSCY